MMHICELRDNIFCRGNWYNDCIRIKEASIEPCFLQGDSLGFSEKNNGRLYVRAEEGNFGINDNCTRGQVPLNIYKQIQGLQDFPVGLF